MRRRMWAVRALFALALLLVPAELLSQRALGQQPYPGVFQPDFRGTPLTANGLIRVNTTQSTVQFKDGSRSELDWHELVPPTQLSDIAVLRNAFGTQAAADRPLSRAYLQTRMTELFPGHTVRSVTFLWQSALLEATGNVTTTAIQVDREVVVDLE